jgi:hypothetical protein
LPINFKPLKSSAEDLGNGLFIPAPRSDRIVLADGQDGIEYLYSFLWNDQRVGALALSGSITESEEAGNRTLHFMLDFTDQYVFGSISKLKQAIGNQDDDFSFIRDIARGLLCVFVDRVDNANAHIRVIYTSVEALSRHGVALPADVLPAADGTIVLAEVFVPAHAE